MFISLIIALALALGLHATVSPAAGHHGPAFGVTADDGGDANGGGTGGTGGGGGDIGGSGPPGHG